ncbi:MAG: S8 family serine peptidase [Candidatus Heimdallarchaeota archaeon]|nr:S8 family serine peptidase [Candidatus Heimdallarchaeota archaeon]
MKKPIIILLILLVNIPSNSIIPHRSVNEESINLQYHLSNDPIDEYILFFQTLDQYDEFVMNNPTIRTYPSLLAVRIEVASSLYNEWSTYGTLFPSSIFNQMKINDFSPDNYQYNGNLDADITGVKSMWTNNYNGTGINVAVMDNGINFNHEALASRLHSVQQFNTAGGESYPICKTHGTPVGGTIASTDEGRNIDNYPGPGNAFGSKLVSIEFGCAGTNQELIGGDILAAFDWLLANNETIQVINTSWGGAGPVGYWDPIVKRFADENIILVGSAGNSGYGMEYTIGSVGPGNSIHAISVGATNYGMQKAAFSSIGPSFDSNGVLIYKPDVMAPGDNVWTTLNDGTYGRISGTSFSSPFTAGAVATLLSALNQNGIAWNTGLIKAALLRGAYPIFGSILEVGQGIVNISESWNLINNLEIDENGIPLMVELVPTSELHRYFDRIASDVITTIPLTLVSSRPDLVSFQINGNLSNIMTVPLLTNDYSQAVSLQIDTFGMSPGIYTGQLNASIGNDIVLANFTIDVFQAKSKVLLDRFHTNSDDVGGVLYSGSITGDMIEVANNLDIWVTEYNDKLNASILSQYDVLWMVDPVSDELAGFQDEFYTYSYETITPDEISAIHSFVSTGGSLMVNFNGFLRDSTSTYGTNTTLINELLAPFGIGSMSTPIAPFMHDTQLLNISSLIGSTASLTHYGNYLSLSENASPVAISDDGVTMAIHQQGMSGRVMVSSSYIWMLQQVFNDASNPNDDFEFISNLWRWMTPDKSIDVQSISYNSTHIDGLVKIKNGSVNEMEMNLLANQFHQSNRLDLSDQGDGNISFIQQLNHDGRYELVGTFGSEYVRIEKTIDTHPPDISISTQNPNNTLFDGRTTILLTFNVHDTISGLSEENFIVSLDGSSNNIPFHYNLERAELSIILQPNLFDQVDPYEYVLTIIVSDDVNNIGEINYIFRVQYLLGDDETSLPDPFEEPSTSEDDAFYGISYYFALATIVVLYKRKGKYKTE